LSVNVTIPAPVSDDDPVPPLATFNVPPSVIVPDDVIGPPDVVNPVVPPETSTELTPVDPDALIVIDPAPFDIEMLEPAVNVANE
jgi:hypothetical protein